MNPGTRDRLLRLLALAALLLTLLLGFAGYLAPDFVVGLGNQVLLMCGW